MKILELQLNYILPFQIKYSLPRIVALKKNQVCNIPLFILFPANIRKGGIKIFKHYVNCDFEYTNCEFKKHTSHFFK